MDDIQDDFDRMDRIIKTNEEIAVKLEPSKTKFPQLYYEAKLYKIFNGAGKLYLS